MMTRNSHRLAEFIAPPLRTGENHLLGPHDGSQRKASKTAPGVDFTGFGSYLPRSLGSFEQGRSCAGTADGRKLDRVFMRRESAAGSGSCRSSCARLSRFVATTVHVA
jgi:hypothetical protein